MATKHSEKKRRQLLRLCDEQEWKCYWCGRQMIWGERMPHRQRQLKDNQATIEHLRDRFDPTRWVPPQRDGVAKRRVAACNGCNNKRGAENQKKQGVERLRELSGRPTIVCQEVAA